MTRDLGALTSRTFDLVIVGGGITGACMAHDAALRGLSVALIEKDDFGGATSAASSKLIHGGIRYLQQVQLGKVRESAVERAAFLRIAPHLVRWVPFLIPTTRTLSKGRVLLGGGIAFYHLLCAGAARTLRDPATRVPGDLFLSRADLVRRHPLLASLGDVTGGWVIHEAHLRSSERMTLAFVATAVAHGATAINYAETVAFLRDGARITGVEVRDALSGTTSRVGGRVVVNAAGPWIGLLNAAVGRARLEREITAFSKGVHIVTRPLLDDVAVAVPTRQQNQAMIQRGGRHFFIIPWRGRSLIGTTNAPFAGTPDEVGVEAKDLATFVADINDALPGAGLSVDDIQYAFAGLYPLTEEVVRPEVYQGTGLYQLVDHAHGDGLDGLVSVLGAKYTTARRLAERAVDLVIRKLGRPASPCATRTTPLAGGAIPDLDGYRREMVRRHAARLSPETVEHLVGHYGTDMEAVVAIGSTAPTGADRLAANQPTIEAEVRYAVAAEMAVRLDDVIFRRTGLGTLGHPGRACLARCASLMAGMLGWDAERTQEEVRRVERRYEWKSLGAEAAHEVSRR